MAFLANRLVQTNAARVESLPAPVGGWNARDSIANMDPTDAIEIVNMVPTITNLTLRGGSTNWATGLSGQVQTLMAYSGGATKKLFAIDATGKKVYDVTAQGAVGSAAVTGLTNALWEYVNTTNSAGDHYLMAVNGADKPLLYNGTTWVSLDGSSTPAITGVTTTSLNNITSFKNRIWFIQKNTLRAWYLPTQAVGGAASMFDLSSVAKYGGYLVDMDTWTIDAGYGVDDNLAFITSNGEVIVYRGTDPDSAATWALIGVWKLGAPVGNRCMFKYGGDLLILTYDGLAPMAASLQSSRLDPRVMLSNKIQGAITQATTLYGSSTGWAIVYIAKNNSLWINVPVAEGQQEQYVMNTITQAWTNFTGWTANCWEIFNDDPYYGGSGVVVKAWDTTYADNGTNITSTTTQAFNYFGSRGVKKYFTRARPSVFSNGTPEISAGINIDFNLNNSVSPVTFSGSSFGLWDAGTWDSAIWGSDLQIQNTWLGVTGIGYCGALQMKTASIGLQIQWASTDVVYQTGWAGV